MAKTAQILIGTVVLIGTAVLSGAVAVSVAVPVSAETRAIVMPITGEHRMVKGDTPESARQLALADARRKAIQALVTRLQERADVKALQLKRVELEAFTAVMVDIEEQPAAPTAARSAVRVRVRARLDAGEAAHRMAGFHKDQDATYELVDAWTRTQLLDQRIADQTRRRAVATSDEASAIVREQLQTLTALHVKALTARAYAALARTEPATVGGRASSASGRALGLQLAETASALSPDSPDARYLQGDLRIEAEQPEAAEAEYRKALEGDAPSSAGRTKLAAALRFQGKLPEALAELREAQRIDPTFARAHSDTGMILRAQRNLPEAIAAYREAIRLDPDSTDAHNGLATSLANRGNLEEAVAEFREIVRIDPDSTIGYYNLAYALADLDRDVESASALREVIRINPNHYNARYNLGELFRLEDKYDDSATQFREYLRLAPETPQNQRNITRARGFIRQFEDPDAPQVAPTMRPRPQR